MVALLGIPLAGGALATGLSPVTDASTQPPANPHPQTTPMGSEPPLQESNPLVDFAMTLAQEPDLPLAELAQEARRTYDALLGRDTFSNDGQDKPEDFGNAYHYAYPIGDVDGDGYDDLAIDTYCADVDGCADTINPILNPCTPPHTLTARSGRTGDVIWERDLEPPHPLTRFLGCRIAWVIDDVPGDDGVRDLLVYEWNITRTGIATITHDIMLIDGRTGEPNWHYGTDVIGYLNGIGAGSVTENLYLLPILQLNEPTGVPVLPEGAGSSLHVRSIGYTVVDAAVAHRELGTFFRYLDYQPNEWLSQVRLQDGAQEWQTDTYQPRDGRAVLPATHHQREIRDMSMFQANHFNGIACCSDITNDGVPDVVYTTYEWTPLIEPPINREVDGLAGTLRVYDGATGDQAYEFVIEEDHVGPYWHTLSPLGDVDGDGDGDYAVSAVRAERSDDNLTLYEYHVETLVHDGATGTELWRADGVGLFGGIEPIGDADGDGGNELLVTTGELPEMGTEPLNPAQYATQVVELDYRVLQGATGAELWRENGVLGLIDLIHGRVGQKVNGLPDRNGDGVADIWVDHVEFLDDLTTIHRLTLHSGTNGDTIGTATIVGALALPLSAGDVDGDGAEDAIFLQGDLVDLWMTAYSGANDSAMWSRRVMTFQDAAPLMLFPFLRTYNVHLDDEPGTDLVFSFTARAQNLIDGFFPMITNNQQIMILDGSIGSLRWGLPVVEDGDASLVAGLSPATKQFLESAAGKQETQSSSNSVIPLFAGSALALGASLGAAYALAGRRWKR